MSHHTTFIAWSIALAFSSSSFGQLPVHETFKNSTAPNWVFGGTPSAYLTAGVIDAQGDGYLRLTNNEHDQTGIAGCEILLPTHKGFIIEFEYSMHDGQRIQGNPDFPTADGICFTLVDSSVNPTNFHAGGFGGSLGYAQKIIRNAANTADSLIPGVPNAYIGIGLDVPGNFSNATEGRVGGTPTTDTSSVTIRGPGTGTLATFSTDYPWIATSITTDLPLPFPINNETTGRSPDFTDVGWRKVRIEMVPKTAINGEDSAFVIYVYIFTEGSPAVRHLVLDSINYNYKPPAYMKMGFTAGTGSGTNIHELRYLDISTHDSLDNPHAAQDSLSVCRNNALVFDPVANDTGYNGPPPSMTGRDFNRATIDLDTLTEGIQRIRILPDTGAFVVDSRGFVTFTPEPDFEGNVALDYSVTDMYGAQSTTAPLKVFVKSSLGDAIDIKKNEVSACYPAAVDITSSEVFTTTAPGTVEFYRDAIASVPVDDPASIATSGTYYIKLSSNGCEDIKPVVVTISADTGRVAGVNNYSCEPALVTIAASGAAPGEGYRWFDAQTDGNLLKTSANNIDSLFTPADPLNTTTDFWVEKYLTDPLGCISRARTKVTAIINSTALTPDAGTDQSLPDGALTATLNAIALTSEDVTNGVIGYWRFIAGPGSPVIQNSGVNTTIVENLDVNGDYLFVWTKQLNTCSKTDTVLLRVGSALPVIYADISATLQRDIVTVNWTTTTEWNNTGFDIERSVDGIHFASVGFVAATNGTGRADYHFQDVVTGVTAEKLYYRLQQTDIDGNHAYSKILTLNNNLAKLKMGLYPNPFSGDGLRVVATMAGEGNVTVRMIDPAGRMVQFQELLLVKGSNNIALTNTASLHTGMYYVEIWKDARRIYIGPVFKK